VLALAIKEQILESLAAPKISRQGRELKYKIVHNFFYVDLL